MHTHFSFDDTHLGKYRSFSEDSFQSARSSYSAYSNAYNATQFSPRHYTPLHYSSGIRNVRSPQNLKHNIDKYHSNHSTGGFATASKAQQHIAATTTRPDSYFSPRNMNSTPRSYDVNGRSQGSWVESPQVQQMRSEVEELLGEISLMRISRNTKKL
jgi:hypothetical protein